MEQPVKIYVTFWNEGATYSVPPLSRKRILERFPDARLVSQVHVGYATRQEFEKLHGPLWKQIVMILTSLSWDQIEELGGVVIQNSNDLHEVAALLAKR
jgi:hypothetical protein